MDLDKVFNADVPQENPADRLRREARERFEKYGEERRAAEMKPRKAGHKRFTTQYAIEWGRAQGWKLLDRERFDARTRRHHDLPLGADAMFEATDGVVYVQGAGRHERAEHRRRFEDGGGAARCERLRCSFVYVEFVRESVTPVLREVWA